MSIIRDIRAARIRTARVNRGLTQAMAMGEDVFAAYERLQNESGTTTEEERAVENRPGGDSASAHSNRDGPGDQED